MEEEEGALQSCRLGCTEKQDLFFALWGPPDCSVTPQQKPGSALNLSALQLACSTTERVFYTSLGRITRFLLRKVTHLINNIFFSESCNEWSSKLIISVKYLWLWCNSGHHTSIRQENEPQGWPSCLSQHNECNEINCTHTHTWGGDPCSIVSGFHSSACRSWPDTHTFSSMCSFFFCRVTQNTSMNHRQSTNVDTNVFIYRMDGCVWSVSGQDWCLPLIIT